MFLDKVTITIKSGKGGDGAVTFHTEKFVPNGGPDGGDGGKGGDIVFLATNSLNTLSEFHFKKKFFAPDGEKGLGNKQYGRGGKDVTINVPVGTVIKDCESGAVIADMYYDGQKNVLYKGGRGGRGNYHFANARRQAPRFAQSGENPPVRKIILELKTIADVGLIGFPNVGKSTLLSVVSNALPKIANYHFTTLSPNLGVVNHYDQSFIMADIPGLIEGASEGAGLGHSFLRHIERVRMLVHVIDISGSEERDPQSDFEKINAELEKYSKYLSTLPMIVALNKMDMPNAQQNAKLFEKKYGKKYRIFPMMAAIHEGVKPLLGEIILTLPNLPKPQPIELEPFEFEAKDNTQYTVSLVGEGVFEVSGGLAEDLQRKVYLNDPDSFNFFQKTLISRGVISKLKASGMKEGDTVIIADLEFEYME